jgi:hypothetical protein
VSIYTKTGAVLRDDSGFAPVFVLLHIYWIFGITLVGLAIMGAGYLVNKNLCSLRVSVFRLGDTLYL